MTDCLCLQAKEALQGWDGKVVVTVAIPAFLVGEDEQLGSFKCFPGKRKFTSNICLCL